MSVLSYTSLAKKMTFSAVAMMASSIILITTVVYLTVISFGDHFLENELNEKAEFIKKAFTEPIWTYDQYQIDEIGNSLLTDDQFTYITSLKIEAGNDDILFEKGHGDLKTFAVAAQMPYTKTKQIDILKGTQKIGKISVSMTNVGYVEAFRNQLIIILISSLVLMVLISQIVRYYFNQTLNAPLKKILNQVHMIESENYRVTEVSGLPDELASISRALHHASSIIEKRNNDIKYYTNDLEKLVGERTAELEDQMTKNLNTARLVAVGEMAADVAHEINNPLTVIDLHVTKLKKFESDLPADVVLSVGKIQSMVKRIAKIIKGLKSLSRDGNADPKVPFMVSNMIDDVKMLVEMKVKSHDISFCVELDHPTICAVGREVQISQVLVNLIGNAVDAIVTSSQTEKWIKLQVAEKGDEVLFHVTDSGTGIPENLQEKIMRPFFTTKDVNKGTGLGLSISKNIVEEHGGRLEYNHTFKNTQFVFTLKKSKADRLIA